MSEPMQALLGGALFPAVMVGVWTILHWLGA